MKKIFYAIIITVMLAGCVGEADYSAREINWDRDICINCLMGLAEKEYSAQAINERSEVLWFDDIGCLTEYMKHDDWKRFAGEGEVKIWVGHCETGEWIDAEQAWYRYGDRTPMGYGYGALSVPNDSTYTYDETMERIRQGYTKREQFLKDKKMLDKHHDGHQH
ncbi:MAG: hypothetical protein EOM83_02370 [Clostridia bacterium]|nr:hypothetical protein [Clostridia bacterium]